MPTESLFIASTVLLSTFFSVYKLKQIVDDENKRICGVYRRLDETKEYIKKEFVSEKICEVKYTALQHDVLRIESKFDNGFKNLDDKITLLLQKINSK